ncbi:MAG: hypothetical protein GEU80_14620 [Dehalococcoidia bacterium]|nr:hypothetical protein [Dehalococcoidia bacterium]
MTTERATLEDCTARYERLARRLLAKPGVERGTMMGFPCLRCEGRFFASLEPRTGRLIVKLPADRVATLVERGAAEPFAPNGRTFREWAALPDPASWSRLANEALEFASEA